MRSIRFSCMWFDGNEWINNIHTLEEMENGDHWEAMADQPFLREFKLKHKRQFTGQTDKNGIPIYEGDIVYAENANHGLQYSAVEWNKETASFHFEKWCESLEETDDIEIVGNIYENPELLTHDQTTAI